MLTRNRTAIVIAVAVLLIASVGAFAARGALAQAGPRGGHHGMFGPRLGMLATVLDLTDAQKAEAKTILDNARQASQPYVTQLREGHQQMEQAVKSGAGAQQLQQIADNQGATIAKVIGIHASAFSQFYALLTPEQKAKADKLHGQFKDRMGERFGQFARPPAR